MKAVRICKRGGPEQPSASWSFGTARSSTKLSISLGPSKHPPGVRNGFDMRPDIRLVA